MKRIILQAIICIFLIGCTTGRSDTIIVYYMHGFVDTSNTIPCSESRKAALSDEHSETMEYDSIIIDHKDFVKIKNYMQNMRYVPRGMKTGISGVDSRITVVYDTLAISFTETDTRYGADSNNKLVYGNDEIIYTIKSLSRYYNYFDNSDLLMWFPEIQKYGLPSTYKHIVYEKFTQAELDGMTIPDSITQTLVSKIIFVDGGEK